MKILAVIGAVLLLLGILSFVVPLPHREEHSVKIGDAKLGVQTQSSERIPLAASIVIVAAGAACLIAGSRKG
jgi:hypothetical protein